MQERPLPAPSGQATIGNSVKIIGHIYSKEDLLVNGEIEGTLDVSGHKLTIGPQATVEGGLKARQVVVAGTVKGNVEAFDRIEIRQEGKIVGDIRTARIIIEDGAYFKGAIDIVKQAAPLAVLGSPEADLADARAEEDIKQRRFTNLDSPQALSGILSSGNQPQASSSKAVEQESEPASWSRS